MVTSEMLVMEPETQKSADAPVDLVYLSSLTMGDAALEVELLKMFAAQLPVYLTALSECNCDSERKTALHTIKGAARSVGALQLSEIAKAMEEDDDFPRERLLRETARVAQFIGDMAG